MEQGAADRSMQGEPPIGRPGSLGWLAAGWSRIEPRLRPWSWWMVGAIFVAALLIMTASPMQSGVDFAVFRRAAARLLQGEALYQPADGHWVYKYAPTVAFFFVPFTWVGLRAAWTIFNLLSALALVRVMRWGALRLGRRAGLLAHLLILVAVNPYTTNLFKLGQADALLLWLLVESEERAARRPWLSGALWATACLFKPPFLLFLLPAAGFQQWRRLGGLAAGGLAWTAAGVLGFGPGGYLGQLHDWRAILASTTPGLLCDPQNQSAWAITCTYLASPASGLAFHSALALLATAVAGLAAWAVVRTRSIDEPRGRALAAAAALYLTAFLSPLGWRTNLLGSIPLFYLLIGLARQSASAAWRRAATGALVVGLAGELVHRVLGWLLGKGQAHELLLHWRYFGLAVLVVAVAALAIAGLEARRAATATAR